MAYAETYQASDIPTIVIDFLATYLVQVVAFAGLIALLVLYVWVKRTRTI